MNRYTTAFAVALLWVGLAHAQDKTFTLTVTTQDLQVLSAALDELPRKASQPVVMKLQQQLMGQMAPPPAQATDSNGATSEPDKK